MFNARPHMYFTSIKTVSKILNEPYFYQIKQFPSTKYFGLVFLGKSIFINELLKNLEIALYAEKYPYKFIRLIFQFRQLTLLN